MLGEAIAASRCTRLLNCQLLGSLDITGTEAYRLEYTSQIRLQENKNIVS